MRISEHCAASPDMSDAAFTALVDDIKHRGQLVPIWRCGEDIIDGRKRYRACGILGLEPVFVDMSPDQDPAALSRSLNVLRTHYTPSQLAMEAERMATTLKTDGRPTMYTLSRIHSKSSESLPSKKKTLGEAARLAGVHRSTVVAARHLRAIAAPEVITAVESGVLSLHAATDIAKSRPKDEQAAVAAQVVEQRRQDSGGTRARQQTPAGPALGRPPRDRRVRKLPPVGERMERTLDQLEGATERLGQWMAEAGAATHRDVATWLMRMGRTRAQLSKLINTHRRTA
jgi:ParB-like chromosome segregation protein Spo0J